MSVLRKGVTQQYLLFTGVAATGKHTCPKTPSPWCCLAASPSCVNLFKDYYERSGLKQTIRFLQVILSLTENERKCWRQPATVLRSWHLALSTALPPGRAWMPKRYLLESSRSVSFTCLFVLQPSLLEAALSRMCGRSVWSVHLLIEELYRSRLADGPLPPPPLPTVVCIDFAKLWNMLLSYLSVAEFLNIYQLH